MLQREYKENNFCKQNYHVLKKTLTGSPAKSSVMNKNYKTYRVSNHWLLFKQ